MSAKRRSTRVIVAFCFPETASTMVLTAAVTSAGPICCDIVAAAVRDHQRAALRRAAEGTPQKTRRRRHA
jgi:hypothetical protein